MKNKKMKKIIFEATALIFVTMIMISNVQATENKTKHDNTDNNKIFIFGFGHIDKITVNGNYYYKGKISGNMSIINQKSVTIIPYFLYIFDFKNGKIGTKIILPKEINIKEFNGYGYLNYYDIPRSKIEFTEYYIFGSAKDINY